MFPSLEVDVEGQLKRLKVEQGRGRAGVGGATGAQQGGRCGMVRWGRCRGRKGEEGAAGAW